MWFSRVLTLSLSFPVGLCGPLGNKAAHRGVVARQDPASNRPAEAPSTSCGDIVVAANQGYAISYASDVMDCLGSLPFDPAVATRFIDYYNTTIQFQSTLAYLRDPPQGYQQPPVDVLRTLNQIQRNVTTGVYRNQYAFEADLQLLVQQIHDTHVQVYAGALSAFSFASPRGLVSASVDGKQPPQIYLVDDVISCQNELDHGRCIPEPVVQINGVDVTEFLTSFAELNAFGYLEPHADFNSLMDSPVRDIQGDLSALQSLTFYPGDALSFKYKNGSIFETYWLGIYRGGNNTGPLATPGDFYNYFVLGLLPASYDPDIEWWPTLSPNTTEGGAATLSSDFGCRNDAPNWCNTTFGAFPDDPITTQADLSVTGTGIVSGYILDDLSTGVLSIPTFLQFDADVGAFSDAVSTFFGNATSRNVTRIIIDLQQNSGGDVLLVFEVFKQIFSSIEPYAGSRMRSHELADILGSTYTNWWNSLERHLDGPDGSGANGVNYQIHAADEWVITDRINAVTGQNFTSWQEHYGPVMRHGDTFALTQRYNLSSLVFDEAAFDGWVPTGYDSQLQAGTSTLRWMPEDMVILTDGLCSSACALFVELMVHQAGVRTIALGGQPITGPMQAVGGTRGARSYDAESLDLDMQFVNDTIADREAATRLPPRTPSVWFDYIGFNLRDQVRENDSIPQQFKYESADCRLFYTLQNVYNTSQLWRDVAHAAWLDPSVCVTNSTGFPTGRNSTSDKEPPRVTAKVPLLELAPHDRDTITNFSDPILDPGTVLRRQYGTFTRCHDACAGGCITPEVTCTNGKRHKIQVCAPSCQNVNTPCKVINNIRSWCTATGPSYSHGNSVFHERPGDGFGGILTSALYMGRCYPTEGSPELGCPSF